MKLKHRRESELRCEVAQQLFVVVVPLVDLLVESGNLALQFGIRDGGHVVVQAVQTLKKPPEAAWCQ
jgi:hypothetical protein